MLSKHNTTQHNTQNDIKGLTSYVLQEKQWYLALTTQLYEVGPLHITESQHVFKHDEKHIKLGQAWSIQLTIVTIITTNCRHKKKKKSSL